MYKYFVELRSYINIFDNRSNKYFHRAFHTLPTVKPVTVIYDIFMNML